MAEDLKIVIGADSSQLSAELTKAENELRKLQTSLKKMSDVKDIEKTQQSIKYLNETIRDLNIEAGKTGKALGAEVTKGANQASNSLMNMGRIVQDAPFGFMGIANNINPLLESFQRLKAETGSTGGALKQLASSFMSGAGLGLAVSVATSLLVVFGDKLFKTSKSATDFSEANKKLADGLISARESANSTGVALQSYVDIAKNGQLPLSQRNEALREANKILGEHGEKLTLTNIGTERATQLVQLYTTALIAQNVAAKYNDRVAQLIVDKQDKINAIKDQQIKINTAIAAQNANADKLIAAKGQRDDALAMQALQNSENISVATDKRIVLEKELAIIQQEITRQMGNATSATLEMTKAFGEMGYKSKEHVKKVKEEVDKLIVSYKKMKLLQAEGPKVPTVIAAPQIKIDMSNILPKVPQELVDLGDSITNFFATIGENSAILFAQALSGNMTLGGFFDSIFKMLGAAMTQLGKTFTQMAVQVLIVKKTLLANPYLALAAGIALMTIGAGISNAYKKQAFATGTTFAPGGMALVGERGPELVNIPRGGQVVPAGRTSQIMGGMGAVEVFGMLRGQDIYFSNKKYSQTYNRTT
jgi:hypothetical protein